MMRAVRRAGRGGGGRKNLTCGDLVHGGRVGRQQVGGVVHELPALAVPGQDDLGRGALGVGEGDEVGHLLAALGVAPLQEAEDVGGVVDALDGELGGADERRQIVQEQGADVARGADVAVLRRAARVDDGHGPARRAVGELVGRGGVRALGDAPRGRVRGEGVVETVRVRGEVRDVDPGRGDLGRGGVPGRDGGGGGVPDEEQACPDGARGESHGGQTK